MMSGDRINFIMGVSGDRLYRAKVAGADREVFLKKEHAGCPERRPLASCSAMCRNRNARRVFRAGSSVTRPWRRDNAPVKPTYTVIIIM